MEKHQKHAKLNKPTFGNFGRNEFSLVGAPCDVIQYLSTAIVEKLHTKFKITYIDAKHQKANEPEIPTKIFNELTDKINYQQLNFQELSNFQKKFLLNEQDLILVNGNHFEANQQIVLIDPRKEQSLQKRIKQLTNIKAFVLAAGVFDIYDFLKVGNWQNTPIFKLSESEEISSFIKSKMIQPPINAMVLAGGNSTRMGMDKGLIEYHGKPQRQYLYDLLKEVGEEVFFSVKQGQEFESAEVIEDKFLDLGPFGAILSAFQKNPNAAWLVVACDLPLLDKKSISYLIEHRNPSKIATAFFNPETNFPEPLITIWEPKAYQILLNFMALGYSCPRKVLINSDIELVHLPDASVLMNANTPQDLEKAKELIS